MNKIIEIKNLSKFYNQADKKIIVLENLNIQINKGEFISILGPSGSGKSTLLNIIGLLDFSYSGEVFILGKDISKMTERERSKFRLKKLGFVFQFDSLLPEFNVLENIELPAFISKEKNFNKSLNLLKTFNLENLKNKNSMELSGGEKQRIAILRAIRNNPEILIADEPTGNLDKESSLTVLNDLKNLKNTQTILMVTHNEDLAFQFSDSIYKINDKKMIKVK